MKRILITGGSSYLGQHLVPTISLQSNVFYTYFSHDPLNLPGGQLLDLRDGKMVRQVVDRLQPDVIIHTAVYFGGQYDLVPFAIPFQRFAHNRFTGAT